MAVERFVYCRTRFVAFHVWHEAPAEYAHLAIAHRHEFHVMVAVRVAHSERAVEFQQLKSDVQAITRGFTTGSSFKKPWPFSCETFAEHIEEQLRAGKGYNVRAVDVSEDGENGGVVLF